MMKSRDEENKVNAQMMKKKKKIRRENEMRDDENK